MSNKIEEQAELRGKIRCVLGYCEASHHESCLYESSRNDSQELDLIMQLIAEHDAKQKESLEKEARLDELRLLSEYEIESVGLIYGRHGRSYVDRIAHLSSKETRE